MSVHVLLVIVQVCFSSLAVVGKLALGVIPPDAIVLVRIAGGAAVFWVLAARSPGPRLTRRDLPLLVACGLLGVAWNQLLFLNGLSHTTATNASVLGSTIPIFATLVAMLSGRERVSWRRAAGIAIALSGTLVLVGVEELSLDRAHVVGNLLILANSASYGTFLVLVRDLASRVAPMRLVAGLFGVALLFVAPFGAGELAELLPRAGARELAFMLFLVAVPTVTAYSLNQAALERAPASLVATYVYLQPFLSAVGAALLLGERPPVRTLAGGAVILLGVALSARGRSTLVERPGAEGAEVSPDRPG